MLKNNESPKIGIFGRHKHHHEETPHDSWRANKFPLEVLGIFKDLEERSNDATKTVELVEHLAPAEVRFGWNLGWLNGGFKTVVDGSMDSA